jgi:hypothetical protein
VAKLRHARERIRSERGKCEGRKTRIERAERENNPDLVKSLTEAVEMAKRLRRASPKTGERGSLRKISAKLAAAGYLNERGQPFTPNSIKLTLLWGLPPIDQAIDCLRHDGPIERDPGQAKQLLRN